MIQISCTINHKPVQVEVEEGETLMAMLRDRLGLTGTKRGCEVGECGACTVLVDGVPTDTCLFLAGLADGKVRLCADFAQPSPQRRGNQKESLRQLLPLLCLCADH